MRANLTISQRGLVLVAVPLLVLLGFIALAVTIQHDAEEAQRWALHSRDVMARAEAIQRGLADAEAGVRGYILTGAPAFAAPYQQAARQLPSAMQSLVDSVRGDRSQSASAVRIGEAARAELDWLATLDTMMRAGKRD